MSIGFRLALLKPHSCSHRRGLHVVSTIWQEPCAETRGSNVYEFSESNSGMGSCLLSGASVACLR